MEPKDRDNLHRALELAEENNRMLKKISRSMRWAKVFRIVSAVVIIGASVGVFYFIQPVLDQMFSVYGGFRDLITGGINR